jgi:hypothetical protein
LTAGQGWPRTYRLSDQHAVPASAHPAWGGRAAGENGAPNTERINEMFSKVNMANVKQLNPRTIAFTTLWLVLLGAALAFIAFAGHV